MQTRRGDIFGFSISGVIVAIPIFIMVAANKRAPDLAPLVAALGGFAGIMASGLAWASLGRPPAERLLRDRPGLALLCFALFVVGLIPTIVWSK
ncbi:MAG: hypothetical protein LC750_09145 [Actinobacteria bacterium]|nr:hypothetical protein [Actinomycetota bacterium]